MRKSRIDSQVINMLDVGTRHGFLLQETMHGM